MTMRQTILLFFATSVVLLSGCASGPKFTSVATPPPGKALVYIYRNGGMAGLIGQPEVYANGELLGKISAGSYCSYEAAPGNVVFAKRSGIHPSFVGYWALAKALEKKKEALILAVEMDKTYYVQCDPGGRLKLVDSAVGTKEIQDCSLVKKPEPK